MANPAKEDDFDFDDTEFVVGSDPSGVPPGLKSKAVEEEVDIEVEDEMPKKQAKKPEPEEDDIELEIVDDTPPKDRNRDPLPEDVKQELEQDEAEEYSANVKKRIDQLKKAWHDERRAKEQAAREREAAAQYAQQLQQERDRLRGQLSQGETWALDQAKARAELELQAAKRAYRDAYEQGDSEAIADAQQRLSVATYQSQQVASMAPRYQQPEPTALQQPQQQVYNQFKQEPQVRAPEPDSKAKEWGDRNPWFGPDDEMTSFALGLHQKLVKDGIPPTTDEYYERIDARMRAVFPDKFGDATPKKEKRQPSTVVAPAGRTPKGKKVVLKQSEVAMAKKLGITPEQYAREKAKLEASNG
jgi:hypothetical protein